MSADPAKMLEQAANLRIVVKEIEAHGGVTAAGNTILLALLWERARVLSNMVLGDDWLEPPRVRP